MPGSPKKMAEGLQDIPSHLAALRSQDGIEREHARQALVFSGKKAVDPLIELLTDSNHQTRWEAAKALSEIADPKAASALVCSLEDSEFGVRWLAAVGLIAIGKDALVPLLKALFKHADSVWLREGAHHVLHDLSKKGYMDLVAPVLAALEGTYPEIEVPGPTQTALRKLGS
jgi:HEAT repeat protein